MIAGLIGLFPVTAPVLVTVARSPDKLSRRTAATHGGSLGGGHQPSCSEAHPGS
jgi:hypothetical protein